MLDSDIVEVDLEGYRIGYDVFKEHKTLDHL
jgi:hypothetical protein